MKKVAIVAARLGSSRLRGKVLRLLNGKPMLEYMMRRLERCKQLDEIVIGTTENPNDDALVDFARERGFIVERGSEEDVLGRYHKIAQERKADVIVRLTGDCPLIDASVTDQVIALHLKNRETEITSNVIHRTFPRGLDTEVLSRECLDRLNSQLSEKLYREHVTNYIYDHLEEFKSQSYEGSQNRSDLRICVDTSEDFELVTHLFSALGQKNIHFGIDAIIDYLDAHPEIARLNASIEQAKIFKNRTKA